jgi:glucoselysine-6-phosphate deglycase
MRGERPLLVAVSQGGKSTNTLAFLRDVREKGVAIATLTAGLDVPVARMADCAIDIGIGDETVGPKTRGYTGTVLCLYLAAIEAASATARLTKEACSREIDILRETIGYGEENLERCEQFYRRHLSALKNATHYLFVGKGCAAAVGAEDALKVLETLCYPSAGYEFEEYLHGPACCTSQGTALFLFLSDDEDGLRMQKLAGITSKATENCYLIDRTSRLEGDKVLRLRSGRSTHMSPFVDIYFGQLISALLTQELGRSRHEAVREIFADMDTKVRDVAPAAGTKGPVNRA